MKARPTSMTVFALYLMIVFGISIVGSLYGAANGLVPYSSSEWLILSLPKVLALLAGLAFWKMLKVGVWLLIGSVLLGWALAFGMGTGFFPNFSAALVVSALILGASGWVIYSNWSRLLSLEKARRSRGTPHA